jgi:hypothetical protein
MLSLVIEKEILHDERFFRYQIYYINKNAANYRKSTLKMQKARSKRA